MTGWTGWMTTPNSCNNKEAAVTPERRASARMRVGGDYHFVFVAGDGRECSFRGTFLEVEPPTRTVETWLFRRVARRGGRRDANYDNVEDLLRSLLDPEETVSG
jgi:uncharacterized protein YndB with AHSA1/START domain